MPKIGGSNVCLYLGADLVAHSNEVSFNFETDTEEVTDNLSGRWAENLPTLNRWSADITVWYNNDSGIVNFADLMAAYLIQEELTLTAQLEVGVGFTGLGYLTNLNPTGGSDAGHVSFSAGFIGTGEIS